MSAVLSIQGLNVSFATPRGVLHAVRDVTVDVEAGQCLGIVGESGSGKTVCSRAAMGLLQGSTVRRTGKVFFDGVEISALPSKEVRSYFGTGMAMIFQDPMTALNPVRKIGAQIAEGLRIRKGYTKEQARKRAEELLAMVKIPDPVAVLEKFPYQLSGGMRQRVMIAIAISCEPKVLFADEPTTALDVTVQAQVLALLAELRQSLGMAVVLVTHDLGVVAGSTDDVMVMYAGEVVEYAPTAKLFSNMRMPYTEALLKSIPRIDSPSGIRLPVIEGRLPNPLDRPAGCGFASRCGYAKERCRVESPALVGSDAGHLYRCFYPLGDSGSGRH
jgi:oligopeptide/dipeptide ABC transporter ATP-binding protein